MRAEWGGWGGGGGGFFIGSPLSNPQTGVCCRAHTPRGPVAPLQARPLRCHNNLAAASIAAHDADVTARKHAAERAKAEASAAQRALRADDARFLGRFVAGVRSVKADAMAQLRDAKGRDLDQEEALRVQLGFQQPPRRPSAAVVLSPLRAPHPPHPVVIVSGAAPVAAHVGHPQPSRRKRNGAGDGGADEARTFQVSDLFQQAVVS